MAESGNPTLTDSTDFSIAEIFQKYVRYWPLFVVFPLLGLLSSFIYLKYADRGYTANGTLLIKSRYMLNSPADKVEALMNQKAKYADLQTEIAFLQSPPVMYRVVQKLGLDFSIYKNGAFKDENSYKTAPFKVEPISLADSNSTFSMAVEFTSPTTFILNGRKNQNLQLGRAFSNSYGSFKLTRTGEASVGEEYRIERVPLEQATYVLLSNFSVQPKIQNTGILGLQGNFPNPYLAADVINEIMVEYNGLSAEQSNNNLEQTISFIDNRIGLLETDINKLKSNLLAYRKANGLANADGQLQQQLGVAYGQEAKQLEYNVDLNNLSQIENYFNSKGNTLNGVISPSSLNIGDATLNDNIQKYNAALSQKRAMVQSNVSNESPLMTNLDDEIKNLRAVTLENIQVLKKGLFSNRSLASSQKSAYQGKANNMPAKISQQIDLEYQLGLKQALFKMLSEKKEEAAISRASYVSTSLVMEKARPVLEPVSPDKNQTKLLGVLFGLLIPALGLFVKQLMDNKVNSIEDIEKSTAAPIIGSISHSATGKTLVIEGTSRSFIAEQLRMIRSNLDFICDQHKKNVLLITSSFGSEGKSFLSTNLASAIALTDKKTIVLEFDLRKPSILKGLGITQKDRMGISNYIVSDIKLKDLIIPVDGIPNLSVLPCGPLPPNPSELLLRPKTAKLFETLRNEFDFVIIDSAPVGVVSDALTLGKYADCTLFVTRHGQTFKKQLKYINDIYENKRLPNLGIVLNDIELKKGYTKNYGYNGYGYYSVKQGMDYYGEDLTSKKSIKERLLEHLNSII